VADDLVVLVLIERNNVRLRGATEFQPWVLRTTQVFDSTTTGTGGGCTVMPTR
jgi:hypothetical protein